MGTRFWSRLLIAAMALWRRLAGGARCAPVQPGRILVIAPFFSGDALLLAPLFAKLRERNSSCELYLVAGRPVLPLFQSRPYGIRAGAFDARDPCTLLQLARWPTMDLAIVAGESRYGWLAQALGARWIASFGGEARCLQNWPVDERVALPAQPAAWGDIVATLVPGPAPARFHPSAWPAPAFAPFEFPGSPYCVLHVEASSPLKHWEDRKWFALADTLAARGLTVVWSAGPQGKFAIDRIDPGGRFIALGWRLDLAQLWHLVHRAALLVSVDTGVGHIGRLTGTPTLVLFGPGSASLYGAGDYWSAIPWRAATLAEFPCRNQQVLFKRRIAWLSRCHRGLDQCAAPRCMHAIGLAEVGAQIDQLLNATNPT